VGSEFSDIRDVIQVRLPRVERLPLHDLGAAEGVDADGVGHEESGS
jgi:hypothetical protein